MKLQESFMNRIIPYSDKNQQWPQILTILVVALGTFTCGAHFSWTSPSIPILISNSSHVSGISLEEASYFTVIPPLASAITSPLIAILIDIIGRKHIVLLMGVPQLLAWILIGFANNLYVFYLSRFLAGTSDSILFIAAATYVGEISEPSVRGSWGNLVAIGIYLGQFFMNIVGSYCDIRTSALIFGCLPIIYTILCFFFLSESPYFLLMKGKEDEARKSLQLLRWRKNVEDEFRSLAKDVERQTSESGTYKDLFLIPTNRKALLISIGIRGTQQLSGIPAFAVYTQYMFMEAGGNISSSTSAIIYSGLMFACISAVAFIVDKFGRKPLMTFSSFSCAIVLAVLAAYFYINKETDIDTSDLKWIPLAGMVTYIVVCATGLGIIPTLMLSELFSASIKSKALCVLHIFFGLYVLSVSKLFQSLTANFGLHVPFFLFSGCCVVSTVFSYYYVPETKGKTLEEIQQSLKNHRKCEKSISIERI